MNSENGEPLEMDQLFSILNSPNLVRSIIDNPLSGLARGLGMQAPTVISSATIQIQQTQSRSIIPPPFSPERVVVTRYGQRYHVDKDDAELEMAPVVHIPEQPVSMSVEDDDDYVQFVQTVISNKVVDDRAEDPSYSIPRNANTLTDCYVPPVSIREREKLIEDLETNPIPGLTLEMRQLEAEPPIVTRSAARHRVSDPQQHHAAISSTDLLTSEPMSSTSNGNMRTRNRASVGPEGCNPSGAISSRTRQAQALAKTPNKNGTPGPHGFKTPLPLRTASPKAKPKTPSGRVPEENPAAMNDEITPVGGSDSVNRYQERVQAKFKNLGKKIVNVLEYENFSPDEKMIVKQLLEFTVEKFSDEQALVLVDYVLRLVALVCGHILVPQILPLFENASAIHSGFAHLALGLLVYDKSPLILQVAPALYGKTKLLKKLRQQLMTAQNSGIKAELISTFKTALIINDHPYRKRSPDLNTEAARMLQISGEEGLLDREVLDLLPEETIHNVEERMAEMLLAESKREEAHRIEQLRSSLPSSSKSDDNHHFPPVSKDDLSRLLDGIMDTSNTFPNIFMQDSPGTPGNCDNAMVDNLDAQARSPVVFGNVFSPNPISSQVSCPSLPKPPRRISLISGPLVGSPGRISARRNDLSGFNLV